MGNTQRTSGWTPPIEHDPRSAVAAGRRLRRQTQAQLADALTRITDEDWSEQMVGKLERGLKEFTIETLITTITEWSQLVDVFERRLSSTDWLASARQ